MKRFKTVDRQWRMSSAKEINPAAFKRYVKEAMRF